MIKKSDLKSGMVVEYRKGDKRLVVNDDLIGDDGNYILTAYNDDLKDKTSSNLDIIKVYRYIRSGNISQLLDDDNLELISERKEYELTQEQIKILKALKTLGFNWIARDKDDDLYAYNTKPKKLIYSWSIGSSATLLDFLTVEFDFIKWSDDEPTNIDDLLKGMSNKKDKIKIFLMFRKIANILDESELSIKDKLLVVDSLNQYLLFQKSMNKKGKKSDLRREREDIKLTNKEIKILKALKTLDYEFLVRNESGMLYAIKKKPEKKCLIGVWYSDELTLIDKDLFTFIKWEDEEPTNINELLIGE